MTADPAVSTLLADQWQRDKDYLTFRPQGASSWLLILTLSGCGFFEHAGGKLKARSGDAVLMAPRHRHSYGTINLWEFQWVHFQPRSHWLPLLEWPNVGPGMAVRRFDPQSLCSLTSGLDRAIVALWSGRPQAEARAMHALEGVLLDAAPPLPDSSTDPRIELVARILREHPAQVQGVEAMAAMAGLSPSRFAHLFKLRFHQSPRAYAEAHRLSRACDLLRSTDWPLARIAAATGFADEYYFSTRFRRHTGLAPGAFRRLARS